MILSLMALSLYFTALLQSQGFVYPNGCCGIIAGTKSGNAESKEIQYEEKIRWKAQAK
jgi:hypothetical protein